MSNKIWKFEELTPGVVTNFYLYGTETTPTNLVDESLIRPPEKETKIDDFVTIKVDVEGFMESGPGRFAIGSQFEIVQKFFDPDPSTPELKPGSYTKQQLGKEFGIGSYGWTMQQYNWRDDFDDYTQRVYLYNTQEYQIYDSAKFVVEADGTKWIENFATEPRKYEKDEDRDNFDFEGGNILTNTGNLLLEAHIDPSDIGRTVFFDYVGTPKADNSYTLADFERDEDKNNSLKLVAPNLPKLLSETSQIWDELFDEGVTKFLDDRDRPIFYASS